jgi:hypothetical protein
VGGTERSSALRADPGPLIESITRIERVTSLVPSRAARAPPVRAFSSWRAACFKGPIMAIAASGRRTRVSTRAAWAVLLVAVAGCAHVAPYERGTLAHPTMTVDDVASAMDEHVRAVSEGPAGGLGGGGGGCGCN